MKFHWLFQFCAWLDKTAISQFIQASSWIVPMVQTVHILSIAAVLASATMIVGRLAGWAGQEQSARQFAARHLPFIWWPLLALLATGIIMIIGEPARELANWVFQLKMLLLITAIGVTRVIQQRLAITAPDGAVGSRAVDEPVVASVRTLSFVALLLWVAIILAGRWIAYI